MAAGAALEAAAGDDQRAGAAIVDGVRAAAVLGAAAEAGEGRLVDADRAAIVVGDEDAVLAVAEQGFADQQVARFEADAGAVRILDADVLEDEALDPRRGAAEHQRRLALAGDAVEDDAAGLARDIGDPALILHRAHPVGAGRDQDGAVAAADRGDRLGEIVIGLAILLDRERGGAGRAGLRGQRRGDDEDAGQSEQDEIGAVHGGGLGRARAACRGRERG